MARTRYIKPDFFTDEDLADLPIEARYFFSGLWCHADREGRLEDRPKFFKIAIFPYDDFDIEAIIGLLALAEKPFIKHYEVSGKRYIQIVNFKKHQKPHHTERDSILPDPKKGLTVKERLDNGYLTVRQRSAPLYSSNGDGDGKRKGNGEGEVHEDKNLCEVKDKPAAPLPLSGKSGTEPTASPPPSAAPSLPKNADKNSDKMQDIFPDKSDTIKKGVQFPESDILDVAGKYCELRGTKFVSEDARRVYLRGSGMFYPAKDLLTMIGGDVDRACLCLEHFAEHFEGREEPLTNWNWTHILADFPKWAEGMRAQEEAEVSDER